MVVQDEIVGDLEEGVFPHHTPRQPDRFGSVQRVPLHLLVLLRRQPVRLQEDPVGHADLADVVERGEPEEEIHGGVVQPVPEPGVFLQASGQDPDVVPGPLDVAAGFVVPGLRQGGQALDDRVLRQGQFPGALADLPVGPQEPHGGEDREDERQRDHRQERGKEDLPVREESPGPEPDPRRGRHDQREPPRGAGPRQEARQQEPGEQDEEDTQRPRPSRHRDRVSRKQVVEDVRVDFHSRLGGVERRGADLLEPGGGGPEQDDPSLQPRRVRGPLEDRGGGQVGKGPVGSAKVHQQVAVTVEGDPPPVKTQRLDPVRSRFEDGVASASPQVKGQGEVRIERPLVADHQGNAAQDSVRVGGDVEKAGGAGRLRQHGQVADDPPGVEEAVGASRSSAGENRRAKRVEDTRVPPRRFEVELVAEDEGTPGERRREGPVGVQRFLRKAREVDPRPEVAQDLHGEGVSDVRSGSANTMSSPTAVAPSSRIRSRRRAIRYRGHGHWPRRSRLASSRSTIAIGPGAGCRGADRRKES